MLQKYGFSNAHLTDLVKCRGRAEVKTEEEKHRRNTELKNCTKFLMKEIRLIKPKLIVSVGKESLVQLKNLNLEIPIVEIEHYSSRKLEAQNYESQFKKIAQLYYKKNGSD